MSHFAEFDYLVFNAEFDQALSDLRTIVRSAQLRGTRQVPLIGHYLPGLIDA